jgi:hypothetical protein
MQVVVTDGAAIILALDVVVVVFEVGVHVRAAIEGR